MLGKDFVVKALREQAGMTVAEAGQAHDIVMAAIKAAAEEDSFRIPEVGVIRKNEIEAHTAKNPATGEEVQVEARFNFKMKSATKAAV